MQAFTTVPRWGRDQNETAHSMSSEERLQGRGVDIGCRSECHSRSCKRSEPIFFDVTASRRLGVSELQEGARKNGAGNQAGQKQGGSKIGCWAQPRNWSSSRGGVICLRLLQPTGRFDGTHRWC